MACNHENDVSAESESPCQKCKKCADDKCPESKKCQPSFKNAIDRYEDRRHDLDERQRQLNEKIAIMEKSIPALMAINMWQCDENNNESRRGKTCEPVALERVREMMRRLSPLPDPADELVGELTARVEQLNRETAELHDKIINADVELEESCMELESLELANHELEQEIEGLENKINFRFNLESIDSDDRICLARIRKLGADEIKLKRSIRDLEEREMALRSQIEQIFEPNKMKSKTICKSIAGHKHHVHRSRHRKKKECQVDSLSEPDNFCKNTGCNALRKLVEHKDPMLCKCQNHKLKFSNKISEPCKHVTHKCGTAQKNVEKISSGQLCNCNKLSEKKSQKKINETIIDPWYTKLFFNPLRPVEKEKCCNNDSQNYDNFGACSCACEDSRPNC